MHKKSSQTCAGQFATLEVFKKVAHELKKCFVHDMFLSQKSMRNSCTKFGKPHTGTLQVCKKKLRASGKFVRERHANLCTNSSILGVCKVARELADLDNIG